ncbi:hypothetical protein HELRODRAFT_156910 [Helobdella robusta]|uniref:Cell cycle control protein 50A n=1 Tax=Helobdella robusta TaxID=6412 RepID=T1EM30_HELRO|nr:hypothetical protein HELRODRAFT_156910 [Helobdella robusta]ESO04971.1 hypothetical protein HELRODRAFT_156910 [Helobdella robusta]
MKQQKLSAWKPTLTCGSLSLLFLFMASLYIPIGAVLVYYNYQINEMEIFYSDSKKCIFNSELSSNLSACDKMFSGGVSTGCVCSVQFELPYQFRGSVFMYYVLTNFYQNHRKYIKSYDPMQLVGKNPDKESCSPFVKDPKTHKIYAPCGAIANSMFNDTFQLLYHPDLGDPMQIPIMRDNIAWDTDRKYKYKNPKSWKDTTKPAFWTQPVTSLDPNNSKNNGYQNEPLIVWMRTAAFPTFKKFYGRIKRLSGDLFNEGLPAGLYTLVVNYNYPTKVFDGSKRVFLTTSSWVGAKNFFTGIAYIIMGIICLVTIIFFKIITHFYDKRFR